MKVQKISSYVKRYRTKSVKSLCACTAESRDIVHLKRGYCAGMYPSTKKREESAGEAVDVDRLLFLIQNNPAIFNSTLKEHHNVNAITKIWNVIGNEMNVPGNNHSYKYVLMYLFIIKDIPEGVTSIYSEVTFSQI